MIPEELLKHIKNNDPTLIEVDLSGLLAGSNDKEHEVTRLSDALQHNTHIRILNLADNNLDLKNCRYLFKALKRNVSIININLEGNDYSNPDVLCFLENLLASNRIIISIDIEFNKITEEDVKNSLAQQLANYYNLGQEEALIIASFKSLTNMNFLELSAEVLSCNNKQIIYQFNDYQQWLYTKKKLALNKDLNLRYHELISQLQKSHSNYDELLTKAEQLKINTYPLADKLIRDIKLSRLKTTNQETDIENFFSEFSDDSAAIYELAAHIIQNNKKHSPNSKLISYNDLLNNAKIVFKNQNDVLDILKSYNNFTPIIALALLNSNEVKNVLEKEFKTDDVAVYELLLLAPEILQQDKNKLPISSLDLANKAYIREQRLKKYNTPQSAQTSNKLYTSFMPQAFKDAVKDKLLELAKNKLAASAEPQQAAEITTSTSTASLKPDEPILPAAVNNKDTVQPHTKPAFKLRNTFTASLLILSLALALAFCGLGIAGLAGSAIALQVLALTLGWMGIGTLTAAIAATAVGGAASLGLTLTGLLTYFKQSRPVKIVTQGIEAGISGTMPRLTSILPKRGPCSFGQADSNNLLISHKHPFAAKSAISNPSITPHAPSTAPRT